MSRMGLLNLIVVAALVAMGLGFKAMGETFAFGFIVGGLFFLVGYRLLNGEWPKGF